MSSEPDAPWRKWPTQGRAASLVGVSLREFRRMVQAGEVQHFKAPDKSFRFDPRELERLRAEVGDSDSDAEAIELARPVEPREQMESAVVGAVKQITEAFKQAQGHAERMVNLFEGPVLTLMERYEATFTRQDALLEKAFQRREEAFVLMEQAKSEEHMRSMVSLNAKGSSERKDQLMKLLKDASIHLLPGMDPRAAAASRLLTSLKTNSPERLAAVLNMGLLTKEEEKDLREALELGDQEVKVTKDEPDPASSASSATNGADIHSAGASSAPAASGKGETAGASG